MLLIRKYKATDYSLLQEWFSKYDWECYPQNCISPTSFLIEFENKPIAFSSLYICEGTKLALLGFTIADKESEKEIRRRCLIDLLKYVETFAIENSIDHLYYFTDHNRMVKLLSEDCNWTVTDNGTAFILAKSLKETTRKFLTE